MKNGQFIVVFKKYLEKYRKNGQYIVVLKNNQEKWVVYCSIKKILGKMGSILQY